jgi:hypothetical protein
MYRKVYAKLSEFSFRSEFQKLEKIVFDKWGATIGLENSV